jgi:hypothetical protein
MTPAPGKLVALRHLIAERFPTVPRHAGRVLPTGIPALDQARGGLPLGAVTELVASRPSSGGHLILAQLLALTRAQRQRVALVDAANCFDPESLPEDNLVHLVWVRCRTSAQAVQATDLVARDANLGLVILDLRYATAAELRRIPGSQWYRLQRAAEPADLVLLVLTPQACVSSAEIRFVLNRSHSLGALEEEHPALTSQLDAPLDRQRRSIASAG